MGFFQQNRIFILVLIFSNVFWMIVLIMFPKGKEIIQRPPQVIYVDRPCPKPPQIDPEGSSGEVGVLEPVVETGTSECTELLAEWRQWLTIVIPSIGRDDDTDYLTQTLEGLLSQVPHNPVHPLYKAIKIIVFNHNVEGVDHVVFDRNEKLNDVDAHRRNYVEFVRQEGKKKCTEEPKLCQRYDFIWTLKYLSRRQLFPGYVLFMEDDWELCPNGFNSLLYILQKSEEQMPDFIALRISYGLNGVLLKNSDVTAMYNYFVEYGRPHKPPDHIIYDFFLDNSPRPITRFRYNIFYHLGMKSTIKGDKSRYRPPCYGYLYDWLQPGEVFDNDNCPWDDISPCPYMEKEMMLVDWDSNAYRLCRHHFPICWSKDNVHSFQDSLIKFCRIKDS